jgi:RHS repeat-associated protein
MNLTSTYPLLPPHSDIGGYRYFFNGQEADNEVLGDGALHAFEYRMHDTRIGRFWSVDPLAGKFPWNSVYAFAENRVVDGKELEGLEFISVNNSGVNPEAYENSDGTYNLSFGDIDFNNVSMTEFNGNN